MCKEITVVENLSVNKDVKKAGQCFMLFYDY